MVTLKGKHIYLRALEPDDLSFLDAVENDEEIWKISNTISPYSKYLLSKYIEQSDKDIFEVKQLRLVISSYESKPLGFIDIFDCDFLHRRAGIGILIKSEKDRQKGLGGEALDLLINYCFSKLGFHQLYCNISEENTPSIKLFESKGFKQIGLKKDWNYIDGSFKSEYLYQLINENVH